MNAHFIEQLNDQLNAFTGGNKLNVNFNNDVKFELFNKTDSNYPEILIWKTDFDESIQNSIRKIIDGFDIADSLCSSIESLNENLQINLDFTEIEKFFKLKSMEIEFLNTEKYLNSISIIFALPEIKLGVEQFSDLDAKIPEMNLFCLIANPLKQEQSIDFELSGIFTIKGVSFQFNTSIPSTELTVELKEDINITEAIQKISNNLKFPEFTTLKLLGLTLFTDFSKEGLLVTIDVDASKTIVVAGTDLELKINKIQTILSDSPSLHFSGFIQIDKSYFDFDFSNNSMKIEGFLEEIPLKSLLTKFTDDEFFAKIPDNFLTIPPSFLVLEKTENDYSLSLETETSNFGTISINLQNKSCSVSFSLPEMSLNKLIASLPLEIKVPEILQEVIIPKSHITISKSEKIHIDISTEDIDLVSVLGKELFDFLNSKEGLNLGISQKLPAKIPISFDPLEIALDIPIWKGPIYLSEQKNENAIQLCDLKSHIIINEAPAIGIDATIKNLDLGAKDKVDLEGIIGIGEGVKLSLKAKNKIIWENIGKVPNTSISTDNAQIGLTFAGPAIKGVSIGPDQTFDFNIGTEASGTATMIIDPPEFEIALDLDNSLTIGGLSFHKTGVQEKGPYLFISTKKSAFSLDGEITLDKLKAGLKCDFDQTGFNGTACGSFSDIFDITITADAEIENFTSADFKVTGEIHPDKIVHLENFIEKEIKEKAIDGHDEIEKWKGERDDWEDKIKKLLPLLWKKGKQWLIENVESLPRKEPYNTVKHFVNGINYVEELKNGVCGIEDGIYNQIFSSNPQKIIHIIEARFSTTISSLQGTSMDINFRVSLLGGNPTTLKPLDFNPKSQDFSKLKDPLLGEVKNALRLG